MELIKKQTVGTTPRLCRVDKRYLKYMHDCDSRVSVKFNNRTFVALAVFINGYTYLVPLTTTTNTVRISEGKKPRRKDLITEIKNEGVEIADLLYSSMFPAEEEYITGIVIDQQEDSFLASEERFIRKHWPDINAKAVSIYRKRYDKKHRDYHFLNWLCCDYKLLEEAVSKYKEL